MTKKPGHIKKDLTVITTHINADFDALASMLAAQKLYPDALVVFPGSQEKNESLQPYSTGRTSIYIFTIITLP
jgi:nanoRNase/pAp phosphatase (c-di-AMP/oligoRNAs hydrolase)